MVPNQLGKRYVCQVCGTTVLCIKGGSGTVECHGQPMKEVKPKPLEASD